MPQVIHLRSVCVPPNADRFNRRLPVPITSPAGSGVAFSLSRSLEASVGATGYCRTERSVRFRVAAFVTKPNAVCGRGVALRSLCKSAAGARFPSTWRNPMRSERRADGWWITEIKDTPDCGPYDTKAEAESDRVGMDRFARLQDKPGFISVDSLGSGAAVGRGARTL